jgi:hypothetical protein
LSFLDGFRAKRQRWRDCRFWAFVIFHSGAAIFFTGRILVMQKQDFFEWTMAWVLFGLLMTAVFGFMGAICCPACRNQLNGPMGDYCRECGRKSIEKATWPKNPSCSVCGKSFQRGSQPMLATFHFCSVCGIKLDDGTRAE